MITALADELVRRTGDAILAADGRCIVDANPAAIGLFCARDRETLLATDPRMLALPTLAADGLPPRLRAAVEAARAGGRSLVAWETRRLDGTTLDVEAELIMLATGKQSILGMVIRDVSQRRRSDDEAHTALLESRRFAETVVEAALDCVIGMDGDGCVVAFNPAAERTFGYRRDEVLGRQVGELIVPPRLRDTHRHAVERHQATGEAHILGRRAQMPALRADGRELTVELIVVEAPDQNRARYVAYLRDLSEQQAAEQALRASEAYFRGIVDDQTELICRSDPSFRLTFCNAAHARLWGSAPADLVGRNYFETIPERIHASLRAELEALTPANPIAYGANEKAFADGSVRWFEWLNRALFDEEGRRIGYQSVGRDVTERRRADEELARHREALAQSERMAAFGSLLAGVAHELNNPLSIVLTQAVLLSEEMTAPEAQKRAERIRAAAERCARIVRSFLAIARARPATRSPVRLGEVIDSALELTAYGLRSSGITVTREVDPGLPTVWADADQLGQIVMNLIVNAEQALRAEAGPRRIRVVSVADAGMVRLDVSDNGPGVPLEIRSRVFDPFFTTKPVGGGTGLGLSICQGLVVGHGGRIELHESPEGGALFRVLLPLADEQAPADRDPVAPAAAAVPDARILIVDDEPEQAQGLADILRSLAAQIDVALGGVEALRLAGQHHYALIISDVRMPDLDGPSLLRALRTSPRGFAGRLILVTGDTLDRSLEQLVSESGVMLIEKPYAPAAVRGAVAAALAALAQEPASGS